jgi:hypothetical protein
MGLRTCTRCGDPKDTEQFAWKNKAKGRRHSHCKTCQGTVSTQHYQAHREEYIDRAKERYRDLRSDNEVKLAAYLNGKACKCGESDPATLEFLHRAGEEKKDTVRRLLGQNWDVVSAEIAKCHLLCANCRKKQA